MLKWSPEPFDSEAVVGFSPVANADDFEATGASVTETTGSDESQRGFRREAGFTDTKSLMNSLTSEERSQVYELVELDLVEDFKIREQGIAAEYAAQLADIRVDTDHRFEIWTEKVSGVKIGRASCRERV